MPGKHSDFEAAVRKLARRTDPRTGTRYGEERARAILYASARRARATQARRINPQTGEPFGMDSVRRAARREAAIRRRERVKG